MFESYTGHSGDTRKCCGKQRSQSACVLTLQTFESCGAGSDTETWTFYFRASRELHSFLSSIATAWQQHFQVSNSSMAKKKLPPQFWEQFGSMRFCSRELKKTNWVLRRNWSAGNVLICVKTLMPPLLVIDSNWLDRSTNHCPFIGRRWSYLELRSKMPRCYNTAENCSPNSTADWLLPAHQSENNNSNSLADWLLRSPNQMALFSSDLPVHVGQVTFWREKLRWRDAENQS